MNKIISFLAICLLLFDFQTIYKLIYWTKEKAFLSNVEFSGLYFFRETWGFLLFVFIGLVGLVLAFFNRKLGIYLLNQFMIFELMRKIAFINLDFIYFLKWIILFLFFFFATQKITRRIYVYSLKEFILVTAFLTVLNLVILTLYYYN